MIKKLEGKPRTKSEINAEMILHRIHDHDYASGGIFNFVSGSQGSGKTSVLLSFVDYTLKNYPKEKVFWSNVYDSPLQFPKIKGKWEIFVQEGSGVAFYDRNKQLEQIDLPYVTFSSYVDLYKKTNPGVCSAVFFGDRSKWIPFIHFLRGTGVFNHVFLDEVSEICPSFTSGELWHQIGAFSIDLKEIRKCLINCHVTSQAIPDVDHRVLTKVMCLVLGPGSHAWKHSRILQSAIDNLEEDHQNGSTFYLEMAGKFGKTVFQDIYAPDPTQNWEAKIFFKRSII